MPSYALLAALALKRGGESDKAEAYLKDKISTVDRDSLYYHLFRLYIEKGYDSHFMHKLKDEQEEDVKAKGLFFLASYYLLEGRKNLAKTYFLETRDTLLPDEVEARIAEWELKLNLSE
jgi:lipoprotein NlpI